MNSNCELSFRSFFLFWLIAFFVSGCASAYRPTPLPTAHPANAAAFEAPLPSSSVAFQPELWSLPPTDHLPVHSLHGEHHARQETHGGH